MDAQAALVLEHLEAAPARAADVEMDDELVDDLLEQREVPAPASDALDLLRRQDAGPPQAVAGPGRTLGGLDLGPGLIHRRESGLDAIGIVAAGVGPEYDPGRGMEELAADDDLVAPPRQAFSDLGLRLGGRGGSTEEDEQREKTLHRST